MKHIIEIEHLSKSFGEVKAVQDLSFHVKEGELFAFLGVNGAGKSTTISIICGQLSKDAGTVLVDGKNTDESMNDVKQELGVVFQNSVLDKALSVRDNLKSRAALYGICGKAFEERLAELAELLDFGDLLKRTEGKLSGGSLISPGRFYISPAFWCWMSRRRVLIRRREDFFGMWCANFAAKRT